MAMTFRFRRDAYQELIATSDDSDQARWCFTFHHKHAVGVAAFDEILKKLWQFPDALVALTDP